MKLTIAIPRDGKWESLWPSYTYKMPVEQKITPADLGLRSILVWNHGDPYITWVERDFSEHPLTEKELRQYDHAFEEFIDMEYVREKGEIKDKMWLTILTNDYTTADGDVRTCLMMAEHNVSDEALLKHMLNYIFDNPERHFRGKDWEP